MREGHSQGSEVGEAHKVRRALQLAAQPGAPHWQRREAQVSATSNSITHQHKTYGASAIEGPIEGPLEPLKKRRLWSLCYGRAHGAPVLREGAEMHTCS